MKERFYYDREGRQILSIDRLGNRVETEYNIDGNPVRRVSCDKHGEHRDVRTWRYDCLGYLKEAVGGGFRYHYEHRPDGKLLCKEVSGHAVLRYTYHPDGNVKTMTDGSGRVLFYGYDHGGRLISVADEAGEIVGYCHTPGGKVKEIRHRNGVRTAYEYDTEGNIIHLLTETRDGGTICDLRYAYDLNGNRTAKSGTMLLPGHPGGVSEQIRDIHYRYDRMDRLTAEVRDGEETSYLYDVCGNRLEKRKGGRTERYHYNGKNQLVRRVAGGDAWDYTYDLQGNLVREAGPEGERQYLYDTENRQIRVLSGGKEIQEERYDGEGMRVGLSVNGKKSTFLYGNGDLYAEFDETGADVSRYIWGYGLAGLGYQEKFYGVHRDEQLSTGWITGGAGSLENAYEYDAFGVLLGNYGKVPGRLLYGGQQYDAEMEQYYLRARYYNPMIGRFMQEDTYRGDGLNLYAYCANNPVMYYDPSGNGSDHNNDAGKNVQKENVTEKEGKTPEELTISARNTGKGNPNAIIHFDADLNTRQQNLLNQLPDYDSSVVVKKSDVSLNDLAALTVKTGDEFAMFTRGSQRLIVRGGATNVNINEVRAIELFKMGYKWSGHTHPGIDYNVKMPSSGDKSILNIFGQEQSVIYDSKGRFEIFGGD